MIKFRKIPHYFAMNTLAIGASLTIGLLSFSGMLALSPLIPLAIASFVLSVGYEGEIYVQNIKQSFKKLFKANYLERELAKQCLLKDYQYTSHEYETSCPHFFKEYDDLCAALAVFQHKKLNKDSLRRKKQLEKKLSDMEKWFAQQLFADANETGMTAYQQKMREWINQIHEGQQESLAQKYQQKKAQQSFQFQFVKAFCLTAAVLMSLGTIYLLIGAFMVVPILSALPVTIWPMLMLPMGIIAGMAYGTLVYNAITDMITNELISKWREKVNQSAQQGNRTRAILMGVGLSVLTILAAMLSLCTFGTWRTVAQTTPKLFAWMTKIPVFVMFVMQPFIASTSIFLFNVENISETSQQVDEATQEVNSIFVSFKTWLAAQINGIRDRVETLYKQENVWQRINPFRMIITLLYTPLRIVAFLGHIVSIAVMGDQVKGVPSWASSTIGAINEMAEDSHYFMGATNDPTQCCSDALSRRRERLEGHSGHNHYDDENKDLPTKALDLLFWPVHRVAVLWDWVASQKNVGTHRKVLTYQEALVKQLGETELKNVEFSDCKTHQLLDLSKMSVCSLVSSENNHPWEVEHALFLIDHHKEKYLKNAWVGRDVCQEQSQALDTLKEGLNKKRADVQGAINNDKNNSTYARHRFFLSSMRGQTDTQLFLDKLSERTARVV